MLCGPPASPKAIRGVFVAGRAQQRGIRSEQPDLHNNYRTRWLGTGRRLKGSKPAFYPKHLRNCLVPAFRDRGSFFPPLLLACQGFPRPGSPLARVDRAVWDHLVLPNRGEKFPSGISPETWCCAGCLRAAQAMGTQCSALALARGASCSWPAAVLCCLPHANSRLRGWSEHCCGPRAPVDLTTERATPLPRRCDLLEAGTVAEWDSRRCQSAFSRCQKLPGVNYLN